MGVLFHVMGVDVGDVSDRRLLAVAVLIFGESIEHAHIGSLGRAGKGLCLPFNHILWVIMHLE